MLSLSKPSSIDTLIYAWSKHWHRPSSLVALCTEGKGPAPDQQEDHVGKERDQGECPGWQIPALIGGECLSDHTQQEGHGPGGQPGQRGTHSHPAWLAYQIAFEGAHEGRDDKPAQSEGQRGESDLWQR